jgi:hypothetical protein
MSSGGALTDALHRNYCEGCPITNIRERLTLGFITSTDVQENRSAKYVDKQMVPPLFLAASDYICVEEIDAKI